MMTMLQTVEQSERTIVSAAPKPGLGKDCVAGKMWVMALAGRNWDRGCCTADNESADLPLLFVVVQRVVISSHGKRHTFGLVDLVVLTGGEGVSGNRFRRSFISIWPLKIYAYCPTSTIASQTPCFKTWKSAQKKEGGGGVCGRVRGPGEKLTDADRASDRDGTDLRHSAYGSWRAGTGFRSACRAGMHAHG